MLLGLFKTEKKERYLGLLGAFLVFGIYVAIRLTIHHENQLYGDSSAKLGFCTEGKVLNCDLVNSSTYSEFLGIPIALFAIPTYLFVLFLLVFRKRLAIALPIANLIGVLASLYSLYLAAIAHFQIGYFCLWCLGLYGVNFSIPLLIFLASGSFPVGFLKGRSFSSIEIKRFAKTAFPLFLFLMGGAVFSQKIYRSQLKQSVVSKKDIWKNGQFVFPFGFSKPVINAKGRISEESLSLTDKVGKGQLVGLLFLTPGEPFSDGFALKARKLFSTYAPEAHLFAVSPLASGMQSPESIWEDYFSLADLSSVELLFDKEFKVGRALGIRLAPSILILDKSGNLVATNLQNLEMLKELLELAGRNEPLKTIGDAMNLGQGKEELSSCAPSFKLRDLVSGKDFSFSPQSNQKKPTLLVFWNALCKHCQIEIPKMMELSKKYKNPFRVLTISRIRPGKEQGSSHGELTEKYIKEIHLPWPVLVDSGLVSSLYKIDATPTSVVVSPEGIVQEVWKGVQPDLEEKFASANRRISSIPAGACQPQSDSSRGTLSFNAYDAQGNAVEFRNVLKKPSVIHFSSQGCRSCQEEQPQIERFSRQAKQRGIDTITVSLDKGQEALFYRPFGGIFEKLSADYVLPRTYLVNEKGEVLKKFVGAQNWDDEIFKEQAFTWFQ